MYPAIREDLNLRELALSEARNAVGPDEPVATWLLQERLTQAEYDEIAKNAIYKGYVTAYKAELVESGFSFTAKAKILAEDLLSDMYHMAKDDDTPAQVRLKVLENLVDWGKLAPKSDSMTAAGAGFSVTINLGGSAPKTINITPTGQNPDKTRTNTVEDVEDVSEKPTLPPTSALLAPLAPLSIDDDLYYIAEDAETIAQPVQLELFPETLP
jgi:hypothetical protein